MDFPTKLVTKHIKNLRGLLSKLPFHRTLEFLEEFKHQTETFGAHENLGANYNMQLAI